MTLPSRVRLKKWGADHYADDDGRMTLCKLRITDVKEPRYERLCVDCRKESNRRGHAALREEMERKARGIERKLARQKGAA